MIDTHTHGYHSYDTDADYNEMILSAVNKGLSGICFSDHFEYMPDRLGFVEFNIDEHISLLKRFNEKYIDKEFKVLTGVEIGLFDGEMDKVTYTVNNYKFDSIIASIHRLRGEINLDTPEYTAQVSKYKAYSVVLEKYIEILPKLPKVNIMGHFDYVSRYSQTYSDKKINYKDFPDHYDKLFQILISKGIAFEINTTSYTYLGNQFDPTILIRYKELGGEMITLGSDAHGPLEIGQKFQELSEIIYNLGFSYITYFEDGKPVFDKIQKN